MDEAIWPTHVICLRDYEIVDVTCLSNSMATVVFENGDSFVGEFEYGV